MKIVQPSAKREGFATVPGVSWADVGALADIREELQLSILAPVRSEMETWKHYLFFAHILQSSIRFFVVSTFCSFFIYFFYFFLYFKENLSKKLSNKKKVANHKCCLKILLSV